MIVELPSFEMTMAGGMADIACEDLFISVVDEDEDDSGQFRADSPPPYMRDSRHKNENGDSNSSNGYLRAPMDLFMYSSTSASESEGDVLMSDVDTDAEQYPVPYVGEQTLHGIALADSPSALTEVCNKMIEASLTLTVKISQFLQVLPLIDSPRVKLSELSFNSPCALTGTPCDTTRRYEYPYPSPSEDVLPQVLGLEMDFLPTPALSPEAESPDPLTRLANNSSMVPPVPAPVSGPAPTAVALVAARGPILTSSSGLLPAPSIPVHPGLARFNPADVPIPPSLRARIARMTSIFPYSDDSRFGVVDVDMSISLTMETPTTPRAVWL